MESKFKTGAIITIIIIVAALFVARFLVSQKPQASENLNNTAMDIKTYDLGQKVSLKAGESGKITGTDLIVTVTNVARLSYPQGGEQNRVELEVSQGENKAKLILTADMAKLPLAEVEWSGYKLSLLSMAVFNQAAELTITR